MSNILLPIISNIEQKLISQTDKTKNDLFKKLDVDVIEKTQYFELNAQSFASGIINLDTSQFIYNKLREYESTSLAERIVLSQIMLELLQKRIKK